MSLKHHVSLVGVLIAAVLVAGNFGCGGASATPPPPPSISVSISAATTTVQAGATTQLTATVTNDSSTKGVAWTVACSTAPCGTVSPASTAGGTATTYTAPNTPPASNLTVTITATSVANASAAASVTITVPAIGASLTPPSATVQAGNAAQFTATVTNDSANNGVTWALTQGGTVCSPGCDTIASFNATSGSLANYTAPATVPSNPELTLTATSVTDTTKSAGAEISIISPTVEFVPPTLTFSCTRRGPTLTCPPPQTTTLTNTGSTTLMIANISITGSTAFSQTNTCGKNVVAKGSCAITVTFRLGLGSGASSGAVSVSDNSGGSPQQVPLVGGKNGAGALEVRSAIAAHNTAAVPSPTGPSPVGTREMDLIDSRRDDPFLADGTKRELLVRFWYPAALDQGCEPAKYTSPSVWTYFAQLAEFPLPEVSTNSCQDAPAAGGAHPIVIFTHGYTGTFTDYTFLFEDLASRGYVVASVDHTYEATAVEFPDGRLVKSVFGSHLAESTWQRDAQSLTRAVSVRSSDLPFVVDELARLNGEATGPFAGRLDLTRVAVAGHSLGGLAAWLSLKQEPRFKAAVLLDASLVEGSPSLTKMPVLVMTMGREQWSDEECSLWRDLRGSRLAVNFKGAEHLTTSDAVWLAEGTIKTGSMGPEKTIEALRNYVAAFLDTNLRGKPFDPLLAGPSSDYLDAEVTTQKQLLCGETIDH
jgi:dienelactone hydrolase